MGSTTVAAPTPPEEAPSTAPTPLAETTNSSAVASVETPAVPGSGLPRLEEDLQAFLDEAEMHEEKVQADEGDGAEPGQQSPHRHTPADSEVSDSELLAACHTLEASSMEAPASW